MKKINPITVFAVLALQALTVIYIAFTADTNPHKGDNATQVLIQNDEISSDFLAVYHKALLNSNALSHSPEFEQLLSGPYAGLEEVEGEATAMSAVDARKRIRLTYDSPMGYHREILVGIDHRATNDFDIGFDAPLIENHKEDMYWIVEDTKCVIQGVSHFDQTQTLPLGLRVNESGKITIRVNTIENMENPPEIFLKDLETGKVCPIIDDTFTLDLEPGEYNDRFAVVFDAGLLSIDDISLNEGFLTYMNNEHSEIRIKKVMDSEVLGVDLYNYLGQRVGTWRSGLSGREMALQVHNKSGLYILNVTTEHGILNKKILIK
jgi:hypothetical protein